jgi:hypothetical protein
MEDLGEKLEKRKKCERKRTNGKGKILTNRYFDCRLHRCGGFVGNIGK